MVTGYQIAEKARIPLEEKWGYIWGKSGQLWTKAAWDRLKKDHEGERNYALSIKYGEKWIGHKVADCIGLVRWVVKQFDMKIAYGSNSLWNNYLTKKGSISCDIPVGAMVFKLRNGTDYYHVGIYVGNGKVIEAQGVQTGVVKTKLSSWGYYGLLKGIEYTDAPPAEQKPVEVVPVVKGETAVVDVPNNGILWVREKPSGEKKDSIREGDEVTILELQGEWARVRYEAEGWVMAKFLRG